MFRNVSYQSEKDLEREGEREREKEVDRIGWECNSCFRTGQHSWTSHEHNESVPTQDDAEDCWQPIAGTVAGSRVLENRLPIEPHCFTVYNVLDKTWKLGD